MYRFVISGVVGRSQYQWNLDSLGSIPTHVERRGISMVEKQPWTKNPYAEAHHFIKKVYD